MVLSCSGAQGRCSQGEINRSGQVPSILCYVTLLVWSKIIRPLTPKLLWLLWDHCRWHIVVIWLLRCCVILTSSGHVCHYSVVTSLPGYLRLLQSGHEPWTMDYGIEVGHKRFVESKHFYSKYKCLRYSEVNLKLSQQLANFSCGKWQARVEMSVTIT